MMIIIGSARLRRWGGAAIVLLIVAMVVGSGQQVAVAASPTTATLTIQKGGDRTGPQAVAGLPGATFDFFAGVSGTRPDPGAVPTASCTTLATGSCAVDVPGRSGSGRGYWIIERTAPVGFNVIQTVDTGAGPTTPTTYNGLFTGSVFNNVSYTFPEVSGGNTNRTARGSQWADRRDNPALPARCGLNIGLLIDVSGSIASSLSTVKAAANAFVDALTGTPSTIALSTFSTDAATILGPTPVASIAGADTLHTAINSLTAGGGTNWDAGLAEMATAPTAFDAVIMLTDGNPTFYGPPPAQGPGNFTRFRELEQGIFSANAVKAEGTKVVAVGVGTGVIGAADNLQAISGPIEGEDYVLTGYAELAEVFRQLALASCGGTISVVKKVIPAGGTPADAQPSGGWTISTSTVGVTPAAAVTDDTGAVNFAVDLDGQPSRAVTLAETLQPGFSLVTQTGINAACTANGAPAPVVNVGPLGFTVDAAVDTIVTCVVLNQAPVLLASVVVNKTWVINGQEYLDPAQPEQFEADLQLTGQDDASWAVEYPGYEAADLVTIGEQLDVELLPPNCSNTASGDLGDQVLVAGLNSFSVTNTVVCTTTLQLLKAVQNPFGTPAPPSAWTLLAWAPSAVVPVMSGPSGITSGVSPGVRYSLGETGVPGYAQTVAEGAVIVPPATGSWDCSVGLRSGLPNETVYDGTNGIVVASIGTSVVCTAENVAQPAHLTLRKAVHNDFGGTAAPMDWVLQAVPAPRGNGLVPEVITGRDGELAVTDAIAVPEVPYALGEFDGPAGYDFTGVTCVLTGAQTVVPTPDNVLIPGLDQNITCTFTNNDIEPRLTLVKQVDGGSADPTAWTLTATPTGPTPVISGASGSTAVTAAGAVAGVGYTLTESGGPTGYLAVGAPSCVLTGETTPVPSTNRIVTLSVGQNVTCTYANRPVDPLPVTGARGLPAIIAAGGLSLLVGVLLVIASGRRWSVQNRWRAA